MRFTCIEWLILILCDFAVLLVEKKRVCPRVVYKLGGISRENSRSDAVNIDLIEFDIFNRINDLKMAFPAKMCRRNKLCWENRINVVKNVDILIEYKYNLCVRAVCWHFKKSNFVDYKLFKFGNVKRIWYGVWDIIW